MPPYLAQCSLWRRDAAGKGTMLLPPGAVDAETLAGFEFQILAQSCFALVAEPLTPLAYQAWLNRPDRPRFDSVGRLAAWASGRLAESLFDFSLLLRGRVAGGTTARAEIQYQQMLAAEPGYVYYGRVLQSGGYTILHYLFFYAMNDWRSSFHGVNDHESDWEQIFIYLTGAETGVYTPQWVAFAAHDFSGDDLRRRWDDPELQKVDEDHAAASARRGRLPRRLRRAWRIPDARRTTGLAAAQPGGRDGAAVLADNLSTGNTGVQSPTDVPLLSLAFVRLCPRRRPGHRAGANSPVDA